MLELAEHSTSWQATYIHCANRKVELWRDMDGFEIPQDLPLPDNVYIRCIATDSSKVYILTSGGTIFRLFDGILEDEEPKELKSDSSEAEPGPISECAASSHMLVAVESTGVWWAWKIDTWNKIGTDKRILPGTLKSSPSGVTASSECGQKVYTVDHLGELHTLGPHENVPDLAMVAILESVYELSSHAIEVDADSESLFGVCMVRCRVGRRVCNLMIVVGTCRYRFKFETGVAFKSVRLVYQGMHKFDLILNDWESQSHCYYIDTTSVPVQLVNKAVMPETALAGTTSFGVFNAEEYLYLNWEASGKLYWSSLPHQSSVGGGSVYIDVPMVTQCLPHKMGFLALTSLDESTCPK